MAEDPDTTSTATDGGGDAQPNFVAQSGEAEETDNDSKLAWWPDPVDPELKNQRWRVAVNKPKAIVSVGKPDATFGYDGLSMHASDNWFVNVQNQSLIQGSFSLTSIFGFHAYHWAGKNMVLSAGGNQTLAAKKKLIVAAGPGYGEDSVYSQGGTPDVVAYDTTDLEDMLKPITKGLETWIDTDHDEYLKSLKLLRQDKSEKPEGTPVRNVEQFGSENSKFKLLRALGAANKVLNRVDRAISRPGTVAGGAVFAKLSAARDAVNAASEAVGSMGETANTAKALPTTMRGETSGGLGSDSRNLQAGVTEEGGANQLVQAGMLGKKAAKLLGPDEYRAAVRPVRALLSKVRAVTGALQEVAEAVAAILGFGEPDTAPLGLLARDGIVLATQHTMVSYAPGGFYFGSAKGPDQKKKGRLEALKAFLTDLWKDPSEEPMFPETHDFAVRVAGSVDLRGVESVAILGGEKATARIEAGKGVEVSAKSNALLSAREGEVEILGKKVFIGLPPATHEELKDRKKEAADAQKEITDAIAAAHADSLTQLGLMNDAKTDKGKAIAAKSLKDYRDARKRQRDAKKAMDAADAKEKEEKERLPVASANAGATRPSSAALASVWDTTKQKPADEVFVWSEKKIEMGTKDANILSTGDLVLGRKEDKDASKTVTVKTDTATVDAKTKVVIKIADGKEIDIDSSGITIKFGQSKMTVTDTAVEITGGSQLKLNGKTIQINGETMSKFCGSLIKLG